MFVGTCRHGKKTGILPLFNPGKTCNVGFPSVLEVVASCIKRTSEHNTSTEFSSTIQGPANKQHTNQSIKCMHLVDNNDV